MNRFTYRAFCLLVCLVLGACTAFSPAFIDLLDPTGEGNTLPNAAGHIIVSFVNNAEVDERLLSYLESPDGGNLVLTNAEKRALRPRARFRVQVTFRNTDPEGVPATMIFEFIEGSAKLVDQNFDSSSFPDLTENDLNNVVLSCGAGVERVEVLPGSLIDVFIPAELVEFQQRSIGNAFGGSDLEFVETQRIRPQFLGLQPDDVDDNNNLVQKRNIDIRQVPVPVVNPVCGAVVAIVMNGVLEVPFLETRDFPSYDVGDTATVSTIGGQFSFIVQSIESLN